MKTQDVMFIISSRIVNLFEILKTHCSNMSQDNCWNLSLTSTISWYCVLITSNYIQFCQHYWERICVL